MTSQLPPDRFDQILIIKRLFEDAYSLASRNDNFSLITALILSDLAVELILKNVIGHLDQDYFNRHKKRELYFGDSWLAVNDILKENQIDLLKEKPLLYAQHEQRNLVQHTGSVPSKADVDKYLEANKRMLTHLYQSVFDADFDNLRTWSFIANESLRKFLFAIEDFLKSDNPGGALTGCYYVRYFLLETLKKSSTLGFSRDISFRSINTSLESLPLTRALNEMKKGFQANIGLLDTEMLLVGLGMSIIDTRTFLKNDLIEIHIYQDGGLKKNLSRDLMRDEVLAACEFQIQYLSNLLRRIHYSHPEIIDEIVINIALTDVERIGSNDWNFK